MSNLIKSGRFFYKKNNFYSFFIILLIFFLDRFSKVKIIAEFNDKTYFINNYINLDLIWNIGIGFGLLSTSSNIFYNLISIIIGIVILFLIYTLAKSEQIDKFIYSIIIGGALGNFYDRLVFRAVPDFIDIHFESFHWFTFNLADIFITIGVFLFIIRGFLNNSFK